MKKLLGIFLLLPFLVPNAHAMDANNYPKNVIPMYEPVETCPVHVLANALANAMGDVDESDPEYVVQSWIQNTFSRPDVIQAVIACPEMVNLADDDTVRIPTIVTNFPGGRQITINYETQLKILKQKLSVGEKRSTPETNPNPQIGNPNDNAIWTNTDPAWYGILVVQRDSLNDFVGPDKNNTLSLKYLEQNIDKFYPQNGRCTSKTALADDNEIINMAMHRSVNIENDSNDYYIAGDASLQWITWAEVTLDVVITVVTVGGGTLILGATKGARAARAAKGLASSMKTLEKIDTVQDYIKLTTQSARAAEELKNIDRVRDAVRYAAKTDEITDLNKQIKAFDKIEDVTKYKNAAKSLQAIEKLKFMKIPQTGNVIARGWRAARASTASAKTLNKGAKVARAGMKSGKIRDWLFNSTMKNIGRVAKLERTGGFIYGATKFVGDMYDWSETSTGDFTSGIDFKPLGLLSADDLAGQENVVNHGMWIMWAGDSLNPADDDAAYLQAIDFAAKFHQDLIETQSDHGQFCDIDIYVVRPIIRNPGEDDASLYYLIMNDIPWTTAQ